MRHRLYVALIPISFADVRRVFEDSRFDSHAGFTVHSEVLTWFLGVAFETALGMGVGAQTILRSY
jgi:uncharacterized membrane protein